MFAFLEWDEQAFLPVHHICADAACPLLRHMQLDLGILMPRRILFRIGALRRLEQLIQEAVITVPRALIAETINLVAVLAGRGSARRLVELARVDGLGPDGDYAITPATTSKGDPS